MRCSLSTSWCCRRIYTLSDDRTEYQIRHRPSSVRFLGLKMHDEVPDAGTVWLFREQLSRAGAIDRLLARFDAVLRDNGYLAMGGKIVDAKEARGPRLGERERATMI
jgi:IS5 family transposase